MIPKKTLIVGAHADDIPIGASIFIAQNPKLITAVTVANGVNAIGLSYPLNLGSIELFNEDDYIRKRLEEDNEAMAFLGVKKENYFNFQLPNELTYLHIPEIIERLTSLASSKGIERILTHAFPEAHPDHEVACFCSHQVVDRLNLEVWEYPLYRGFSGNYQNRTLIEEDYDEIQRIDCTSEEFKTRIEALRIFKTQDFIVERFGGPQENFGRIKRDFSEGNVPKTTYFYKDSPGHPTPEQIRAAIISFLS